MNQKCYSILWLDDEFDTHRAWRLTPWHEPLRGLQQKGHIKLTTCGTIEQFGRHLGRDFQAEECNTLPLFNLIILDVMLTEEKEKTFGHLGFRGERLLKLDAGAQIAGLIRNPMHTPNNPPWLQAYAKVPLLLLSNSPTLQSTVHGMIGSGDLVGLTLESKQLEADDRGRVGAASRFEEAVKKLLGLAT